MKRVFVSFLVVVLIGSSPSTPRLPLPPVPSQSWPMYQDVPSHNAVFEKPQFRRAWVTQLGDRINGGLAIVGDTVYVDSFDHCLYALDLATGKIRWKAWTKNVLMSTPVVSDGRVIVGSGHDGFLGSDPTAQIWGQTGGDDVMAFDARTGRRVWSYHTQGEDMSSPAITRDSVVFANGDLHAYALGLSDGHLLWRRNLPGIATMASATIAHGRAFISICHNMPHFRQTSAIDVRTGKTLWSNPNGSCDASPALEGQLVLVDGNREPDPGPYNPGGRDIVAAIDAHTGRTIWRRESPPGPYTLVASGEHAIAGTAVGGILYQSIVNHNLVAALDERNGKLLWSVSTAAPVKMSPVVTSERIIFGDTAGLLYSVARHHGAIRNTIAFKDPFSTSSPVIVGETLIVANGKYVFAIPLDLANAG